MPTLSELNGGPPEAVFNFSSKSIKNGECYILMSNKLVTTFRDTQFFSLPHCSHTGLWKLLQEGNSFRRPPPWNGQNLFHIWSISTICANSIEVRLLFLDQICWGTLMSAQRGFSCTYLLCTISSCCTSGCTSSARVSVARVLTSDPRSSHAAAMSTRWCCSCSLSSR